MELNKKKAFTLLELLVAMAITSIISITVIYVFRVGFEAWQFGYGQAMCQSATEIVMSKIVEGDYYYDGLREALDIVKAKESEIDFIPWYEQKVKNIAPMKKFKLEKKLLRGACIPIGEVFDENKKSYDYRRTEYFLLNENGEIKDYVRFNVKKNYLRGRLLYYPDPQTDDSVVMKIYYDKSEKMVYRCYRGVKKPLLRGNYSIKKLKFSYYDNTNNEIDLKKLKIVKNRTSPITAVLIEIEAEKETEKYTLRSFVNIRRKGYAGYGIFLTENSKVRIPNSKEIQSLLITNFGGITEPSEVIIDIENVQESSQNYRLKIYLDNIKGVEYIKTYTVEYPKGDVVYKKNIMKPAVSGINLLTLDPSGNYDYDDDEGIADVVIFEGKNIELKVEKMEIGGMNLFVK